MFGLLGFNGLFQGFYTGASFLYDGAEVLRWCLRLIKGFMILLEVLKCVLKKKKKNIYHYLNRFEVVYVSTCGNDIFRGIFLG